MARVIKHFEGNGTGTPYTVPAGKVAQIQGFITCVATDSVEADRTGSFTFGDTTVFMASNYYGGVHWVLNSDATHIQQVGLAGTNRRADVSMRAGSTTQLNTFAAGPIIRFEGTTIYNVGVGNGGFDIPAPRIYIGAGDSLSFTQGTDNYIGYNIIAIEEDV
jgi:hypothetical protein